MIILAFLSPPGQAERACLEQEEDAASEADHGQAGCDPQQGREELGSTLRRVGGSLWSKGLAFQFDTHHEKGVVEAYREDEIKRGAGDDDDENQIGEDPGCEQLSSEGLVRIVGALLGVLDLHFRWC